MELKEGYKLTEVGVTPEDWELKRVKQIIEGGKMPSGIYKDKKLYGRGTKIAKLGDVFGSDYFVPSLAQRVVLTVEEAAHYRLNVGDIIIALASVKLAGVGDVILVKKLDEKTAYDHNVALIRLVKGIDAKYIFYLFKSNTVRDLVAAGATQVGTTFLKTSTILNFQISLPSSKAEQEAIAEALSDADGLIESLEQLINKKCQIKQGTMQELLTGKKRLPGFAGDWKKKTFDEIFLFLPTATNSRSDLGDSGNIYYIHYGDIHTRFHSHLDFTKAHPSRIDRARCRNAATLKNGDWVMADASEDYDGVGKTIEIQGLDDDTNAIAGLHTFLLREKTPTFEPGFKGHLGNLKSLHEEFLRVATGMKVFGVSKAALRELYLPIPPPKEQTAIATILSDMNAEIAALEAKQTKARQIKQGMMQELLTGRIRLISTQERQLI